MKVEVIGSGTFTFYGGRPSSCYLVHSNSQKIIFDFGEGALIELSKRAITYEHIHHIFLTHYHTDHCAGLVVFLETILCSHLPALKYDVHLYGPKGLKRLVRKILKTFRIKPDKEKLKKLNLYEFKKEEPVHVGQTKIKPFFVQHASKPAVAYRIQERNKVFTYSGDSTVCPGIRFACEDADVALLEVTGEGTTHLTAKEAAQIADEAGVKNVVLTHIPYKEFKLGRRIKEFERMSKIPVHQAYEGFKFIV
ncbi:MAG: MBL fold metallo-hydrolase [Candidatus Nanoarchaeia archaeon]